MSNHSLEDKLDAVYQSGGDRDRQDMVYDQWARDYDQDLWASGNPYIALMAGMVGRHVPDKDSRILDAGCGTGNMAQLLAAIGYKNIVGIDASQGMLDVAKTKGCYREVHQMWFSDKIKTLEKNGAWILKDQSDRFRTYPFSEQYEDLRHWIYVYSKV
ncbi:MAG: methyltransferase domain-containing protein [Gammaproteobacteria bacterium]